MATFMIVLTILSVFFILMCRLSFGSRFAFSRIYLWFKRKDRYGNLNYYIIATVSFICIILYIGLRWSLAVFNIASFDLFNAPITEFRSANLSIFFMLDLCSILGISIPILCIVDWKHKRLLKPLSYLALLGGFATIFFTIPDLYNQWTWQSFLVGTRNIGTSNSDEPLMFLMHYWMIILAFIVIVSTTKVTWKDFSTIVTSIVLFAIYIFAISYNLNVLSHVTAIVAGDYVQLWPSYYEHNGTPSPTHPSYGILYIVNNWQLSAFLVWIYFTIITVFIILSKNLSCYLTTQKTSVKKIMSNTYSWYRYKQKSIKK